MTNEPIAGLRGRQLAARLREVVDESGISGIDAAAVLGLAQSTISRLLTGRREPNAVKVAMLLGLCRVPAVDHADILDLLGPDDPGGWWVRPHGDGSPEEVSSVRFGYATAATIECWSPGGLPALVQTSEFIDADLPGHGLDEQGRARWVRARREHQALLFRRDGPTLVAYLDERVLSSLPVPEEVRQGQFIRLAMLIGQGRLHVRIVPADRDSARLGAGFSLLRFAGFVPVVCVPGETVTLLLEHDRHRAAYERQLATLNRIALSTEDSKRIILALADERPRP